MDVHGHVVGDDGVPRRVTGMAQDVTDRVDAEEALRRQATEDTLTRLPNRGQLAGALSDRLDRRRSGEGVALLLMDLDRFKEVNDSLGHEVGDKVLVEVAERLRQTVRTTDLVTRLGGDEFAIVVSDLADDVGRRHRRRQPHPRRSRHPVEIDGITVPLGASVGIAYAPGPRRGLGRAAAEGRRRHVPGQAGRPRAGRSTDRLTTRTGSAAWP